MTEPNPPCQNRFRTRLRTKWGSHLAKMLLALALVLIISWPRLLQHGLTRLLAEQGWQLVSLQGPRTGLRQFGLDSMVLRRAGEGGSAIALELHDVKAGFSWQNRRLSLLQAGRVGLHWQQSRERTPAPWPKLPTIELPLDRLQIDVLDLRLDLADGRQWNVSTPMQLEQYSSGRYAVTFEVNGQPVLTKLQAGEPATAELSWHNGSDSTDSLICVTYANQSSVNRIGQQEIILEGQLDIKSSMALLKGFIPDQAPADAKGEITLKARAALGEHLGDLNSLLADFQVSDLQMQIQKPGETALQLDGAIRLEIKQLATQPDWTVKLKPGLALSVKTKSDKPWQADVMLDQAYTLQAATAQGKLPVSLQFGNAEQIKLVVENLKLSNLASPDHFKASGFMRVLPSSFLPDWPRVGAIANWHWHDSQLEADGKLTSQGQLVLADWRGNYAGKTGCTNFRLQHSGQLSQLNGFLQTRPAALAPLMLHSGSSQGSLTGKLCPKTAKPTTLTGEFVIRQGKLGWAKTIASGLELKLRIDDLQAQKGTLSAELERIDLATSLQLSPVRLKLDLANNRLDLHEISAGLLDGRIASEPTTMPMPPRTGALVLDVEDVDLARLLAMIDLPGLDGTGSLSGKLPVSWTDGKAVIRDGRLQSMVAGQLRYQPSTPVSDNIGLQALRDFHYSRLDLGVNYDADGQYRLALKLDGHNPQLYSGHPIAFKMNINGALPGLFQGALLSGDFSAYLLKQLEQGKLQ